jgi:ketosteroid isomerase-like protein
MQTTFSRTGAPIILFMAILITPDLHAASNHQDYALFENIFRHWTQSFNHKDLAGSCSLFSENLVADYRGAPQKNYASICDGFKKVFSQDHQSYQYDFRLREVYRAGDLAVARITWYLRIYANGKPVSRVKDEGMDVFAKNPRGEWKIINYLAYATL